MNMVQGLSSLNMVRRLSGLNMVSERSERSDAGEDRRPQQPRVRVVVLGAGYAGMLAAIRFAGKSPRADVTLIGDSDFFVERVRLHQYAANQHVRQRRIADILRGTRISFLRGTVEDLDLENHRMRVVGAKTEQTDVVAYDYLMYAAGSLTNLDGVAGVREHAYSLKPSG